MSKIRIKSITEKKGGRVVIDYLLDGDPQRYSTSDKVSQAFVDALDSLKPDLIQALQLEKEYGDTIRMESVQIDYKTNDDSESIQAQLIASKDLCLGDEVKLKTPSRYVESQVEGQKTKMWSAEFCGRLNTLQNKAIIKIKSDRRLRAIYQQGMLAFDEKNSTDSNQNEKVA